MPLYRFIASTFFQVAFYKWVTGLILLIITGVYLISLNTKYLFLGSRSFMPFLFFVMISGSRSFDPDTYPVLMALPFLIWSADRLISSYRVQKGINYCFEAGLLVGVASFFYAPAAGLIILVLVGIYLFNSPGAREYLVALIGFLLPFGFYIAGLYLLDKPIEGFYHQITDALLTINKEEYAFSEIQWIGCIFLVLTVSSYFMLLRFQTRKIIVRRSYTLFFWWFIVSACMYFIVPSAGKEIIVLSSVPVVYLFGEFFQNTRNKKWAEVLLWLMILSLIFMQIGR